MKYMKLHRSVNSRFHIEHTEDYAGKKALGMKKAGDDHHLF
jgi:hypothetical protein